MHTRRLATAAVFVGRKEILARSAGGSVKMGNKGHRDNYIKVNVFIEKRKKLIFIVIEFILAIVKNICQRKLFVWYHIDAAPFQAELEKYRCDYDICGDMIYISFSYSVSEFAYDTVKRAAYFTDVGFFDPNRNSQPVLFENRCPMLLEGEWFRPVEADDFDCISEKLGGMTMKNRSYLLCNRPDRELYPGWRIW